MTQIDFYTHVESKLQTACLLSAKAAAKGMRVMVFTADAETTGKLDRLMWSVPATGFIPHCRSDDRLAAVTPVIIDHVSEGLLHYELLLNLRAEWPSFFSRFQRLIEIVSTEETDRRTARERFRFYRDRGYEIRSHAIGKSANPSGSAA